MDLYASRDEPTVVCDTCGTRFREVRASCPRCATRRARPELDQVPPSKGRRHGAWLATGGLALAVLVSGLMAWPSSPADVGLSPVSTSNPLSLPTHAAVIGRPEQLDRAETPQAPTGPPAFLDAKGAATFAYTEGRVEDALAHFQEVLAQSPDDPEALNNVGQVLVRLGRATEALPYLERAAARFPDRWDFQFNLARALAETGHWSEAVERYRAIAAQRPDDHATAFNLARALERAGRTPEAIPEYRRALQLAPDDPSFHLALALAHERTGDLEHAQHAYEGYLTLLPDGDEAERVKTHIEGLTRRLQERGAGSPPQ